MKTINRILAISAISIVALGGTTSCNKYLDIAPGSIITPDNYFNSEEELGAYAINMYTNGSIPNPSTNNNEFMVNDWGLGGSDAQTDNQMNIIVPERMIDKGYSVPSSDKKWDFGKIYNANFFFDAVLPKYEAGKIKGNKDLIKHYIGEMYFFRAAAYFEHLKRYGDFPIVKTLLKNDMNILVEASKRSPRNEVARFILEDLDKAIDMMKAVAPDGKRNRLFKDVAILYKARVALYEGTFLKNFKGTPFVPKGAGWPGESKAFGSYAYPTGSIDAEIAYFLDVAMKESKIIADKYSLTENTYKRIDKPGISNPYYLMFADDDLSKYPEVLMWRQYNSGLSKNIVSQYASKSNGGIGVSRSLVQAFVDKDGKPWYAAGSKCEDLGDIMKLVDNRDSRALLFLKVPGQINIVTNADKINNGAEYEPKVPNISSSVVVDMYLTGYTLRKYLSPDGNHCNSTGYASAPSFRASEAYLTYTEACYEKSKSLDADAQKYWKAIRKRAGVNVESDGDYQVTINNTNMTEEGKLDWAAWSGGKLVDATLFSIRRDRRCEFIGEGMRLDDITRWRSMDQLITDPYQFEGMKIWNCKNESMFTEKTLNVFLKSKPNSDYIRIFQKAQTMAYNGLTWRMAHYLSPLGIQDLRICSPTFNDATTSTLYQNPYWPLEGGAFATK